MAASVDLTTLAEVKRHLGITGTDDDTFLGELIDQASQWIEEYCGGRQFAYGQKTEYYDGGGEQTPDDRIFVDSPPIQTDAAGTLMRTQAQVDSYLSVYDDTGIDFASASLLDTENLRVDAAAGVIRVLTQLAHGTGNIKVVYYGGYSTVPPPVNRACQMVVAYWYNQADSGADGITRESEAGLSATYSQEFPPANVAALLADYVRGAL